MPPEALTADERALLDKLAHRVAELRMETPAILTLETARPLSLVASQAMIFFEPFAQMLFRFDDYRRLAQLIERRDAVDALTQMIEHAAEEREAAARPGKS
jgi:hypothetical protein